MDLTIHWQRQNNYFRYKGESIGSNYQLNQTGIKRNHVSKSIKWGQLCEFMFHVLSFIPTYLKSISLKVFSPNILSINLLFAAG